MLVQQDHHPTRRTALAALPAAATLLLPGLARAQTPPRVQSWPSTPAPPPASTTSRPRPTAACGSRPSAAATSAGSTRAAARLN